MDGWRKQLLSPKLSHSTIGRAEGKLDFANFETEPSDRRTRRPTDEKGPSATATTPARERYAATEEKTNHSRSERASEASHDECEKLSRDTDRKGERRFRRGATRGSEGSIPSCSQQAPVENED